MQSHYFQKVIVIAGGASGIGRELARELASYQARVIIADINLPLGEELVRELSQQNPQVSFIHTDLTDITSVEHLVQQVVSEQTSIDFFFNCVGIVQIGEIKDTPLSTSLEVIDANMHAMVIGTQLFYRQMITQQHGHIINFGSGTGLFPTPLMGLYGASKFGIVGLTHALRAEAALYGVKVSAVCPGLVKTPIYETARYHAIDRNKVIDLLFHRMKIQSPEDAAHRVLKGTRRNQMTIHTLLSIRFISWVYRLNPSIYTFFAKRIIRPIEKKTR